MVSNYAIEEGETEADKLTMVSDFLLMWAKLYPCRVCGGHFEEMLKRSPPPKNGALYAVKSSCIVEVQEVFADASQERGRTWKSGFVNVTMK